MSVLVCLVLIAVYLLDVCFGLLDRLTVSVQLLGFSPTPGTAFSRPRGFTPRLLRQHFADALTRI